MLATLTEKLLKKLSKKEYRDAFVDAEVRTGLAHQIRALRGQRGWSQQDLADRIGTTQSAVSRIEDPDYGTLTVSNILQAAAAFDVAVILRFVSFPEMLIRTKDVSPKALEVQSWDPSAFTTIPSPAFAGPRVPTPAVQSEIVGAIGVAGAFNRNADSSTPEMVGS